MVHSKKTLGWPQLTPKKKLKDSYSFNTLEKKMYQLKASKIAWKTVEQILVPIT